MRGNEKPENAFSICCSAFSAKCWIGELADDPEKGTTAIPGNMVLLQPSSMTFTSPAPAATCVNSPPSPFSLLPTLNRCLWHDEATSDGDAAAALPSTASAFLPLQSTRGVQRDTKPSCLARWREGGQGSRMRASPPLPRPGTGRASTK